MNERIKQLVRQAGGHISTRNLASNPVQYIEDVELWNEKIEKFAELIVRECADVVLKWKSEPFPYDPEFGAKIIKEHFGIEDSKGWVCPLCGTDRTRAACPKGHSAAITGECPMVVEAQ